VITLRRHQIEIADAIEMAWRCGTLRPLVDACVGSGKSLSIAELCRRACERGERSIVLVHKKELAFQDYAALQSLGVRCGLNGDSLGERTWRAPVIVAMINSVYRNAAAFGHIDNIFIDECHLIPHSQAGMYRQFLRGFPHARQAGFSGTVFRLQGGSLVEGEEAPFDKVVYRYSIIDGIRDGYLVPAFSASVTDTMDLSALKTRQGEYTGDSQDTQMLAQMDNHICQLIPYRSERRAWLIFEASVKAARAMCQRLNEWGIRAGLVIGDMPDAERTRNIEAFRRGELQAIVNKDVLTTGFDNPRVDLLAMRFATKSLGKYIQVCGRLLRTVGGNIESSIAAGKSDGLLFDWGGNISTHGPLDFIRPRETKARLVSCDECGTRNAAAAARCWKCDAVMTKNCPACLVPVAKGTLDCPHCAFDMRSERSEPTTAKLFDVPSGAALIASWKGGTDRSGGWQAIRRVWEQDGAVVADGVALAAGLAERVREARWIRADGSAILLPNGASRTSARQVTADGAEIIVPLPAAANSG